MGSHPWDANMYRECAFKQILVDKMVVIVGEAKKYLFPAFWFRRTRVVSTGAYCTFTTGTCLSLQIRRPCFIFMMGVSQLKICRGVLWTIPFTSECLSSL